MTNDWFMLVALPMLAFAAFIVLTFFIRKGDRPGASPPLALFIFYVIGLSLYVGFSGNDMWPFAAWRYVAYAVGQQGNFSTLVGVDESGQEHHLDTRTFEPLEFSSVTTDVDRIDSLTPAHRDELLRFLLKLVQEGLARAQHGEPVGRFTRFLGPFSAPIFHVAVTPWSDPQQRPHEIDELRVYRVFWTATEESARIEKKILIGSTKP
jgi:hypothetical protein